MTFICLSSGKSSSTIMQFSTMVIIDTYNKLSILQTLTRIIKHRLMKFLQSAKDKPADIDPTKVSRNLTTTMKRF